MDNLHAPTVPSGPTSAPATNGNAAHLGFAELQRKKDDVEAELKALGGVLDSVGFPLQNHFASATSTDYFSAWGQYGHATAHT
jgi:26S proteasome non-ATPase regulatory subunit 9